ncbi:MAG: hypothetical protein N2C14_09010 [Planctomycetales bacterium]
MHRLFVRVRLMLPTGIVAQEPDLANTVDFSFNPVTKVHWDGGAS